MDEKYNRSPISLREGHIFFNGVEGADGVSCQITITPETWSGRVLGDLTPSTRWLGYSIQVTVTRLRTNAWLEDVIAEYRETHVTPEITIQGIQYDKGSDYGMENGSHTVTCVGCVPTGDLTLLQLDSEGDVLRDSLTFSAKDIV